jgi:GNAT superfamily N-acetyltransferase
MGDVEHMTEVVYRTATIRDIAAIRGFEQGVISAERAFDSTLKPGEIHYYDVEQMISDPRVRFIVAECRGEAIGCGFARIDAAKSHLAHARQAYLGLMYVDPQFRRRLVNGTIFNLLKDWCRSKAVSELRLEVYCGNTAAISAYEKSGFSQHVIEMRLGLGLDDA